MDSSITEPACSQAYRDKDRLPACERVRDGFRDESRKPALVLRRMSDGALQKLMGYVSRRLQKQNDPADTVTRILIVALAVSSAFGGTLNRYLHRDCKERMKQLATLSDGALLGKFMGGRPVGQNRHGVGISRCRALAMKVICEDLHVCRLSLQRASEEGRDTRDYNVVDFDGRKYVVDLMVEPGALYPYRGFKACAYIDGIQEVKEEPGSPEQSVLGAKFMGDGGEEEIQQYLRSDTSEIEVARPSWHVEGHKVQRLSPEPVACGGFGSVFKAAYSGKSVAEKRLSLKGRAVDSHHILDFVVEVALMRGLQHPNVLECIGGCIVLDVRPRAMMLLTPWMLNGSLRDAILHEKVKKAHHFLLSHGMARGLGYLHSRGIVHCDMKSLNVMLDQDMVPCIGDFGTARLEGLMEQRIDSGACNGTPAWEAPEQIKRRHAKCDIGQIPSSWRHVEVTHKADVYAFGLVIWEMHNQAIPVLEPRQKLRGELPELQEGASWAPLVASCCAGLPENRPDMEQVVHDLSEAERTSLKQKVILLETRMKLERQKNKKMCAGPHRMQRQQQPLVLCDQTVAEEVVGDLCAQVDPTIQLQIRQPAATDPCRFPGPAVTKPAPKRSVPQGTIQIARHPKKRKVEAGAVKLDAAIIEAIDSVDHNDTKPQATKACPAECGFGGNRVCSIRKSTTHTSYIMVIKGSDAGTRQQLCQLTDSQCHGHSMPWINFVLKQTVHRKLDRPQVLALHQKIIEKFEAEGQSVTVG